MQKHTKKTKAYHFPYSVTSYGRLEVIAENKKQAIERANAFVDKVQHAEVDMPEIDGELEADPISMELFEIDITTDKRLDDSIGACPFCGCRLYVEQPSCPRCGYDFTADEPEDDEPDISDMPNVVPFHSNPFPPINR